METEKNEKVILEQIPTNTSYSNDEVLTTFFTHKVSPKTVDDLIVDGSADLQYAEYLKEFISIQRQNFSQQQLDFSYNASKLITGQLKENKPVLIPVRCGFGKSTLINSILLTRIYNQTLSNSPLPDLEMIVVTERIEDLKILQQLIKEKYGLYNHFKYENDNGTFINKEVDWMYVMESWNKQFPCKKHIKSYEESIEKCGSCEFRSECKIGEQMKQQYYSPIIGITSKRLYYYAEAGKTYKIKRWRSKEKDGIEFDRQLLLIDEKPKLTKVSNVSEKSIDELSEAVSKIEENNDVEIRSEKKAMKKELAQVKNNLNELVAKFDNYRNAYVKLKQNIFTSEFLELWNKYLGYKHKENIDAIIDMYKNGAIYCKTGKYDLFKTISMATFQISDFKTLIFDGTAELSLEYDVNDFNLMAVEDFREYSNVTFHMIKGNYSKSNVKKNVAILFPIIEWINKNVKSPTFVVSYQNASSYLYDNLNTNENVVKYKSSKDEDCIPYFGYTRGMNCFKQCTQMIQIGWNRWDSDTYIANRIATNKKIKKIFDDKYIEKFEVIQNLLKNDNGIFAFSDIEMYKLMQMINDFEQEAFRTQIREFLNESPIDIFIFNCNKTMQLMIEQRFVNCIMLKEEWIEIKKFNLKKRKNSKDIIVLKLEYWLQNWDGNYKVINQLQEELGIKTDYWKKITKKFIIKKIWKEKNIKTLSYEGKYCIKVDSI